MMPKDTCPKCGAVRVDRQIGLESALDCLGWATGADPCDSCWICAMVKTFREVRRVLRHDGVMWVNVGSSYASEYEDAWTLRDDLTPEERRYVLGELLKADLL